MHRLATTALATLTGLASLYPSSAQSCPVAFDANPGTAGSFPDRLTCAFGNALYFVATSAATGSEVYRWSSGTGFKLLKDIRLTPSSIGPNWLTPCCLASGPTVFFATAASLADIELWRTDGTAAGTVLVKDIRPGTGGSVPVELTCCEERVFFSANDGTNGVELWVSDGTSSGTTLVKNISAGSGSSFPGELTCCNGKVFFSAYTPATGRELWVSDGTSLGTTLVKEMKVGTSSSSVHEITCCGGVVFFHACDATKGCQLWKSDGTPTGTVMVNPNASFGAPTKLTCCNGVLYFTAVGGLWKSDGTAAGTVLVSSAGSSPDSLTCANGRVFFSANGVNGRELWVSDGTPAGTVEVKDIVPGAGGSFPQQLVATGSGVCFHALTGSGRELWFSDGTAAGTKIVCDLVPGTGSSSPTQLTTCGGQLFMVATTPTHGTEVFRLKKPGATLAVLGEPGRPGRPTLGIRNGKSPVLGSTIEFVAQGPATYTGFLLVGPSLPQPLPAIPVLMDGGCDWVGAFSLAIILASTTQQSFSLPTMIPNQAALDGTKLNFQMWWANGSATPLLQASNGLQVVLSTGAPQ